MSTPTPNPDLSRLRGGHVVDERLSARGRWLRGVTRERLTSEVKAEKGKARREQAARAVKTKDGAKVPSATVPDLFHTANIYTSYCTCQANVYRVECKHLRIARLLHGRCGVCRFCKTNHRLPCPRMADASDVQIVMAQAAYLEESRVDDFPAEKLRRAS